MSEAVGNVMLDSVSIMMNGGSIELLTDDGRVIAELRLSDPAAMAAADGELEFNPIAEGDAVIAGQATTARVIGPSGDEIFLCDVGGADSDAVIRLGTTSISIGAPVRLNSFRLSMP